MIPLIYNQTFYNYMKQRQSNKLQNTPQNKQLIGLDLGNSELRIAYKNKEIRIRSTLFIQNSNIYVNKRPNPKCLTDSVMLMDYKFQSEPLQHIIKYYNCYFSKGANQNTIVKLSDLTFIQQFYFQFALALIIKGSFQTNATLRYLTSSKEIKMLVTFFAGKINPFRIGLKTSLKLAGIEDCSFVSTSACIAANFLKSDQKSRDDTDIIAVIDFGSQGLSFSCYKLYHMEIGVIENLFQDNTFLGGSKLTNLLVDYTVNKLIKDKGMDISKNPQLMHRLRLLSQQAKCILSSNEMAFIRLDGLPDILMYGTQISVQQFQLCIQKLMLQNFNIIKNGLSSLKQRLTKIIVTGNSCKIPFFRKLLNAIVKKQDIVQANQHHLRKGLLSIRTKDFHLVEICHFQLRVQGDEKLHQILIKKGEVVPARKKLSLKFPSGQLTYSLKFYQNNQLVATSFIPERPRQNNFNLYVQIDHNKMLSIYATTSQGLIKMNTNMMDLPREEYIKYDQLLAKVDFHIQNE